LANVLTFGAATVWPARHSSSSWVEIGTRTMFRPFSAIPRVMVSMLADHRPWKTRSEALKPNQFTPVSQTSLPASSTILFPLVCSQSVAGTAATAGACADAPVLSDGSAAASPRARVAARAATPPLRKAGMGLLWG
jgi:hypothetical protein